MPLSLYLTSQRLNQYFVDITILELTKMNTGYILQYSVKIVNSVNKFFINLGEYATFKGNCVSELNRQRMEIQI